MEPQIFNVIAKVHTLLKDKPAAQLTDVEVAYITGLLEGILDYFGEPMPNNVDGIRRGNEKPWYKRIVE